jgi:hypothetical protein
MEALLEKNNVPQAQIDKQLEGLDNNAAKNMNLGSSLTMFAFSIMISGIFALIFSLIVKRKRPTFQNFPESIS